MNRVCCADSLSFLSSMKEESVDMVYTDPPFGTQQNQTMNRRSRNKIISSLSYPDIHEDYLSFIVPNIVEMHRVLKQSGTMYLHLNSEWVHYVKVECDRVFGRHNFMNEIVWTYDFGGRGKNRWPKKHDTILVYTKSFGDHVFNWNDIDRLPYMSGKINKAQVRDERGKVPTDVWWCSIIGTNSRERTGYPNQKPVKIIKRAIIASTNINAVVLDPFAGSGSTAQAALDCDRRFVVADSNKAAIDIMRERFSGLSVDFQDLMNAKCTDLDDGWVPAWHRDTLGNIDIEDDDLRESIFDSDAF